MSLLQERVVLLLKLRNITQAEAARRGRFKNAAFISDIVRGHKDSVRGESLNQLATGLGTTISFLLGETEDPDPRGSFPSYKPVPQFLGEMDLPVYAAVEGGPGEMVVSTDPIEMVPRPWYLKSVREGYAVVVIGHSMEPRYEAGEIVVVNPKAALARGKDAIVTTAREGGDFRAMIKTYMGATEKVWRLKQYNPPPGEPNEFEKSKKEWPFALRVVGRYDGG